MKTIFIYLATILAILNCFSLARRTGKRCEISKISITLMPVRYIAYNLATYTTVENVFCLKFPTFRCPAKIEKTRVVSSIQTRLEEKYVIIRTPVCCGGYREVTGTQLCEPICDYHCQNGGFCYKPNECLCKPQYQGLYCQIDVDECAGENRCDHGCTNFFGSYQCNCNRGYYLREDGRSCEMYSININSFKATPKSTESIQLDWQIEVEPTVEDATDLIQSISMAYIEQSDNLDASDRSRTIAGLNPSSEYVFQLTVRTIYGDSLLANLVVTTPDERVQCDQFYRTNRINPCAEGSLCQDSSDPPFYTCECLPGFAEPNCENINECDSNPCRNGGSCVDGVNDYNCICTSSRFTGKNCSDRMSLCEVNSSPCNGNGECIDGEEMFTCNCESGFEGDFCEREINHCTSQPCQNGATCTSGANGPICDCEYNFSGDLCDFVINPCLDHNCNSGECLVDQDRNPVCLCEEHRVGLSCEIECKNEENQICVCDKQASNGECQG